jgi:hypothetical protein
MSWRAFLLTAALALAAESIGAEATPLLAPGTRLQLYQRVKPAHLHNVTLIATSSDSFIVVRADEGAIDTLQIALRNVRKLEVYAGRKSHWLSGAGIGMLVGGAAGGIIGGAYGAENDPDFAAVHLAAGVIIGAASGLVGGAVVGAFIKTDRWKEVPREHLLMGVDLRRHGAANLRISWRF